ncbi:MAG TPA: methyl-accepting chemotaxis protein [Planctomycetaceae bacterium]|nr:methyl-accepting chemotaxis protein [Planctomycetaceae bacterium]
MATATAEPKTKKTDNSSQAELELQLVDFRGQVDAINRSNAVIEFDLDGTILSANENFLGAVGYSLDEIVGRHHSLFVDEDHKNSPEYKQFWQDLANGKFQSAEYCRFGKGGKQIWIQASYNPIFDSKGNPFKVVKYAVDITDAKLQNADYEGQLEAISKAQAVIEFNLDGTILTANDNFLNCLGYSLQEVQGNHHRLFVEPEYAASSEYAAFWDSLRNGEFQAGEFRRFGKGGKEIWIQASYNPIYDQNGEPFKVVKYATDITEAKLQNADYEGQLKAIDRSQAVIEFELDGTIRRANENFLSTLGYAENEIVGQHHRMFVSPEEAGSVDYRQHWEALARGEFKAGEYQRFTKSGEEIWIQASYNPIFDQNGRAFKIVKYASDITAEKHASLEATKVKNMMEGMAAAITFADQDLTIQYANPSAVELLRKIEQHLPVAASHLIGQSIDIFNPDPEQHRNLLSKSTSYPFEGQITIGEEIFLLKANTVNDAEGEHLGILVTWELVTEKVAQEKLIADNIEREREQAQTLASKAEKILELVTAAAEGDLTRSIDTDSEDAIDQIANGLNTFFGDLRKNVASIADNASALAGASEELSSVSTQMSANAEETSSQANVVSSASDEVSQNVQTTATGVEELNAAIREIAKNASDAARVSQQAVSIVDNTNTTIAKLGDSSTEIGKVVKVITSIAEQTNLLALNATIKAARAGEAGKGFAVVANEVKELAKETAKATEDISHKIETIQSDTGGAVEAIQKITEVINQINDISSTIASAVEEQTATANEMGRNVTEASKGASEIASNITSVASAAESTSQGAANSQQAANELSRMAAELQELVGRFQY